MADLFIKQAEQYAQVRPSYPPEFFEFIASKTPSHDLAWDVGAGSGQAARSVSFFSPSIPLNCNKFFLYVWGLSGQTKKKKFSVNQGTCIKLRN